MLSPSQVPDWLQADGRTTFTVAEAARLAATSESSVRNALVRLQRAGEVYSPTKGFYVVVAPARRRIGRPTLESFLDPLMRSLDRQYYVGWLTAASLHGATHHGPQRFQLAVNRQLRLAAAAENGLHIHQSDFVGTDAAPVEHRSAPSGALLVASKELTAIDLAAAPRRGGGVGNVASVLVQLGDLNLTELGRLARFRPASGLQRLGYLLSVNRPDLDLAPLRDVLDEIGSAPAPLDRRNARKVDLDPEWNVYVNAPAVVEEHDG